EWVHVQLHQQKGMISLSPPTICNSARRSTWQSFASTPLLKLTSVKDNYGLTTFSFSFQCRPF
ncbi:hypothetical protein M8U12_20745, partial [Enterobacter hormaechei]|nr:hypothetical protein [Enterobacter hormaechei]